MEKELFFTTDEESLAKELYDKVVALAPDSITEQDISKLKEYIGHCIDNECLDRDVFGLNPIIKNLQTAIIVAEEMGMKRAAMLAIMLDATVRSGAYTIEDVEKDFGTSVARIIHGLIRVNELYQKSPTIESENFRNLLLSFAEDMRVILIMIADRVNIMRQIKDCENDEARQLVANEAAYLYAPLAHKLGLYKLKSELEDLSLKYTEKDVYYHIKEKLNQTKASRDKYIAEFIEPVRQKLENAGLKFHIKGRTKSIHSIYQKMKKQKCAFENVYDLFAIRVILDSDIEKEKMDCWQAYSIVTDMYQPNPKRLRDWLSVPKSNGYESLHITVMGPQGKWVEVQIRTERMDEIAERGLAAHWRYKGVKGESGLDEWLTSVREALENSDSGMEAMDQFKLDLYEDEVFVFTPKGDLFKLAKGSTVLDFAFQIHTKLGCKCTGAKVNGKNTTIKHILQTGDQVEVLTSNSQTPKQDWLNIVTSSKARTKIRQVLKEISSKQTDLAKEDIDRKLRNRKIEYDEGVMMRLIKKLGFKVVSDFYRSINEGTLDTNAVIDKYVELQKKETEGREEPLIRSAEEFNFQQIATEETKSKDDVLVIDKNLKGLDFKLAKCCNPIYGDDVFGFVSVTGGVKIHRRDCPNAPDLRNRFGYRIVKARWAGKSEGTQYPIRLHVVGNDDIGIVTNITSIISKETGISLRSIGIDSHDGLFTGNLTILVSDTGKLETLIKKIKTVRGVKQVLRN